MKFLISLLISFALMHYAHSVCTTVLEGDWCSKIESRMGCTSGTLYRLSTAIDGGCTNLKAGDQVCCTAASSYVAPSYVAPSYVAPSYVAPVYNGNCYTVAAGDTCANIESRLGWAANTIVSNNGAVNTGCTNLYIGQVVCPGTRYTTSNSCYTVAAGDTCDAIERRLGWATGTIVNSGNGVVAGCTNLVVGQQLCNYNRGINYNNNYNYNTNYNTGCYNGYYGNGCTTVNAGEGCYDVEKRMGWAVGTIVSTGAVDSWCSNLAVGKCVCSTAAYYASANNYVAPANNYVAPANNYVAPVVTYTCGRYSTVSVSPVTDPYSGQILSQGYTTCEAVANSLGITVAALTQYNNLNCASIPNGQQICF